MIKMNTIRQIDDRRKPNRRRSSLASYDRADRRNAIRRSYMDRRDNPVWRYSWLRISVSQHLLG